MIDPRDVAAVAATALTEEWLLSSCPSWLATNLVTLFQILREDADSPITPDVRRLTGREPRMLRDSLEDHKAVFRAVEG